MQAPARVVVMATLATKSEETDYLVERLRHHNVVPEILDLSLQSGGIVLDGPHKLAAMDHAIAGTIDAVNKALDDGANAVIGLGGGTGGELALRIMRALPITFPKVLVTTLPFDPRIALADASIVLVPTLADLSGLNATLREILENAAAMTAGLCATRREASACTFNPSVGMTSLGATEGAVVPLVKALRAQGVENTVFHANGFGGAAFQRFAERGAFHSIIDLTPHELTRIHLAGAHVPMPTRFTAAGDLPRIVLPGALNFIGLGEKSLVPPDYLKRPHYEHSGFFTHVKLTVDEMAIITDRLTETLNAHRGPVSLIVPMGGFSHQDGPGGAIEDPDLRGVFLERAKAAVSRQVRLQIIDAHISAPAVTTAILAEYAALNTQNRIVTDV